MDKRPVYPGEIPIDLDVLVPQRNLEIALGFMMRAAFGTGTLVDGLAVTQTVTPSMQVLVGQGSIITASTVDTLTTGFGSLAVDNSNPLVKMGINLAPTTMGALTAPATTGYSVNVLVEAQFIEADGGPVVLPYYNATNPMIPYTGPDNAGSPNNTARTQTVQLQYKYGTAAASGSQVTPSPDAGWIGVAVVTVANGASTIVNSNITAYVGAAGVTSIPTKLPAVRQRLTSTLNLYVSPSGSDSNSGLSVSVPFNTLQKAWNTVINNYDLAGQNVVINLANGTYTAGLVASGAPPGLGSGNSVTILGDPVTPANVVLAVSGGHCITAASGARIAVSGLRFTTSGSAPVAPSALVASNSTISITGSVNFGSVVGYHMYATEASIIVLNSGYQITGGGAAHLLANAGAIIEGASRTVAVSGTPAFTAAFAVTAVLGTVQMLGMTYTGPCTGQTYNAASNGVINTSGGGASFFPGNVSGSTSSGGQYV